MPNALREAMPDLHAGIVENMTDPITIRRGEAAATPGVASPFDLRSDFEGPANRKNFWLRLADWPQQPARGDVVTHLGAQYTVLDVDHDGFGAATLITEKQG